MRPTGGSIGGRHFLVLACVVLLGLIAGACSIEPIDEADLASPAENVDGQDSDDDAGDATTAATPGAESPSDDDASEQDEGNDIDEVGFRIDDPASLASIADTGCASFFELSGVPSGADATCHTVTVPEDWADTDNGRTVELPVVVFAAQGTAADDAVVYLEGGPGGNAVEALQFGFNSLVAPFNEARDFIVFDQRGAGLSDPVLDCPETDEATIEAYENALDIEGEEALFVDAISDCRSRLGDDGIDLTAYHSVYSAIDTEAIRQLLGYEPWNVLGISYGTRLGQTLMRMYPEGVRSIVLDSVVPVTADMTPDFAPNAERAFEQLFVGCETNAACSAEFPTFREDYFDLVDEWDASPVDFEVTHLLNGETYEFKANGDNLINTTFSALYSPATFAILPQLVADAKQGDYSLLSDIVSLEISNAEFVSIGMLVSVRCHEEEPFEDASEIEAMAPDDPYFARLAVDELTPICELWQAGEAAADEDQLVTSDIPTLLMAGEYDPITPPSGLPVIAEGLDTSWSFVFPHEGHGVAPSDCGATIVNAFFDDPGAEPDSSCLSETDPPAFTPVLDGDITMVPFSFEQLGASVSGLRPEEWDDQGFGVYARYQTIADPTLIMMQPSAGVPNGFVIEFLVDALSWPGTPEQTQEFASGAGSWEIYEGLYESESIAVGFLDATDGGDVFVAMGAYPAEYDDLYIEVFLPALEAARG